MHFQSFSGKREQGQKISQLIKTVFKIILSKLSEKGKTAWRFSFFF